MDIGIFFFQVKVNINFCMELVLAFHLWNFEIFSDISWLRGIVITRKSVFEDMGTGSSGLEILREPESLEDQLTWNSFTVNLNLRFW